MSKSTYAKIHAIPYYDKINPMRAITNRPNIRIPNIGSDYENYNNSSPMKYYKSILHETQQKREDSMMDAYKKRVSKSKRSPGKNKTLVRKRGGKKRKSVKKSSWW